MPDRKILPRLIALSCLLAVLSCGSSYYKNAVEYRDTERPADGIAFFRDKLDSESAALDLFDVHRLILQYYDAIDKLDDGFALYARFRDKALTNYIAGLRYQYEGLNARAVDCFKKTAELLPDEYALWYDMSVSYSRLGKLREARGALARSLSINDGFAPALHDMGVLYGYGRNEPHAGASWLVEAIDNYLPVEKNSILDAQITLAVFAAAAGDYERARDVYARVINQNFERTVRMGDPGEAFAKTGDTARAVEIWKKSLDLFGQNSTRGRHFFKKLQSAAHGIVDMTGIKYKYATIESRNDAVARHVYASEGEPIFTNPERKPLFDSFQKNGLTDLKFDYEVWMVEYVGVLSQPKYVQRWVQTRGVVDTLKTKDGLDVHVSIAKSSMSIQVPDPANEGYTKGATFWNEGNPVIAVYRDTNQIARVQLPYAHFHQASLIDVDGDGREDLVTCGFDAYGQLQLDVHLWNGRELKPFAHQVCDLAHPDNGFVLVDLDGRPGLELVVFRTAISWAEVHARTAGGFVRNDAVYPGFARDFARRYSFLDQQQVNARLYSDKISDAEKAVLPLLLQYRAEADAIVARIGQ